jgi:hypothetical protein
MMETSHEQQDTVAVDAGHGVGSPSEIIWMGSLFSIFSVQGQVVTTNDRLDVLSAPTMTIPM